MGCGVSCDVQFQQVVRPSAEVVAHARVVFQELPYIELAVVEVIVAPCAVDFELISIHPPRLDVRPMSDAFAHRLVGSGEGLHVDIEGEGRIWNAGSYARSNQRKPLEYGRPISRSLTYWSSQILTIFIVASQVGHRNGSTCQTRLVRVAHRRRADPLIATTLAAAALANSVRHLTPTNRTGG